MSKHTPGPWDYEDPMGAKIGLSIVQAGLKTYEWEFIAMVCQSDKQDERLGKQRFISPKEQEANARLIAAAPDLLGALKAMQKVGVINPTGSDAVRKAIDGMNAAIAKAEGGTA